mmetsp:Transcript_10068/g.23451  ORF Transcript_10068/g.23451 Transcript_10068/m.23451 type:complete len:408 (+) Transcript_10068:148-1371(+)|eukprot:CAMPEP_0177706352 /NCGR_PEP_ID=MMETSP0484_2-20121128/9180_1 /TAXON_ID=354590 /ORGANISM="Rhodomonas lens, Strain RHODO" /LENGTH=407 /DNA_ID=CAMNT_0019217809 /DNA_START=123 /DNA_END=1346 /DNA_ORIENTATION=-
MPETQEIPKSPAIEKGPAGSTLDIALQAVLTELRNRPHTVLTKDSFEGCTHGAAEVSTGDSTDLASNAAGDSGSVQSDLVADAAQSETTAEKTPLYVRPPHVRKGLWTELGDCVSACEKRPCPSTDNMNVPGDRWISLRLDGSGFSKFTSLLRQKGVFSRGYSHEFASIMVACARDLLERVNGYCAYTQSDEMTVLIAGRRIDEKTGQQFPHDHNGRVQKLASQSAAFVASRFNWRLMHLFARKGLLPTDADSPDLSDGDLFPSSCLATFDCRVGSYASLDDALALVLWRSYDCGVNGVSDKVHHLKGDDAALPTPELRAQRAEVSGKDVGSKLAWLGERGLLPLPDHQAYGSFLAHVRRRKECLNRKSGAEEAKLVRVVEHVPGNLIVNFLRGALLPADDRLDAAA